jgi:hypothetical protein
MPKGGKLSYVSLKECLDKSESDSDVSACREYFAKKAKAGKNPNREGSKSPKAPMAEY